MTTSAQYIKNMCQSWKIIWIMALTDNLPCNLIQKESKFKKELKTLLSCRSHDTDERTLKDNSRIYKKHLILKTYQGPPGRELSLWRAVRKTKQSEAKLTDRTHEEQNILFLAAGDMRRRAVVHMKELISLVYPL